MKKYIFLLLLFLVLNPLEAQETTALDYPTITLRGTENPKALVKERIVAINELLAGIHSINKYDFDWETKKLTKEVIKCSCTHEVNFEEDVNIEFSIREYPNKSYYNIYITFPKVEKQIYNGYIRTYKDKYTEGFGRYEPTKRLYAYLLDIKKLSYAKQFKGLQITKIEPVKFYKKEVNINRPKLAIERIKAINELYTYELSKDRLTFSMEGTNRVKFVDNYNCETVLSRLKEAKYNFKEGEELPHQIIVDSYSKHSSACPLRNVNFSIHSFSSKELADLFLGYISEIRKILYVSKFDSSKLNSIKTIPSTVVKRKKLEKNIDLSAYKNHPQLKYLGESSHHPDLQKLMNDKSKTTYFNDYDPRKGYYYEIDKNNDFISAVHFIKSRRDGTVGKKRVKKYKGTLPPAIEGVEVNSEYNRPFTYNIYRLNKKAIKEFGAKAAADELVAEIAKRKNATDDFLIKTKDDLKRFADPKGDDIWKLIGYNSDPLLTKYLYNENTNRFGGYSKGWKEVDEYYLSNRNFRLSTRYGYRYVINRKAAVSGGEAYLKDRLPLGIDKMKFDLSLFLPKVFNHPQFAGARFGDETVKLKKITYKVIELKFDTPYGYRYIIIFQHSDEKDGYFSKLTLTKNRHGGYITTNLVPLTRSNNPWKTHDEDVLVDIDKTKEASYIKGFSKVFGHLNQGFSALKKEGTLLQSENDRDVFILPNTMITQAQKSVLGYYENNGTSFYQINVSNQIKDEIYTTFLNNPDLGTFHLSPGGIENEAFFGKCMLIKKGRAIIGILKFDLDKEGWWIRVYSFSEEKFKNSLTKIINQASKDNYSSWTDEKIEDGTFSSYTAYNARKSMFRALDKETEFRSLYENTPQYLFESILSSIKEKTEFAPGIRVLENVYDVKTSTRYVKFMAKGKVFLFMFKPDEKNSYLVRLAYGDDYSIITKKNFEPLTLNSLTTKVMKELKNSGNQILWSQYDTNEFFYKYNTRNKPGYYMLMVFYETKNGKPLAKVSVNYKGKGGTESTKDISPYLLFDGFASLTLAFDIPQELDNFQVYGEYNGNKKGKFYVYLLKKI